MKINMIPVRTDSLKLRTANVDDMLIYYEWVNDQCVRQQSFKQEFVLWVGHQKWYQKKLYDKNCLMYVMEVDERPVGQIRFDIKDGIADIDYSLGKQVRGRNWGGILVNKGMALAAKSGNKVFRAEVKSNNTVSSRIFLSQGFIENQGNDPDVRIFLKTVVMQEVK